jgi:UPF0176 protein
MNPKLDYLNFLQSNEKYINDKSNFIVVAFYKFFELQNLKEFQDILRLIFNDTLVKGTILLAKEGINGTIAGMPSEIKNVLDELWNLDNLNDLEAKYSLAPQNPFFRMKIRLKKEIVTLGIDNISPKKEVGKYIRPENWNSFISDESLILIDTRNDYEVSIGSFDKAINPNIKSFREFPNWVSKNLLNKGSEIKKKKIGMFCTGGIRCEKSTSYLKSLGFEDVYHLEGGILKYLEKIPENETKWNGSCFVFDYRVSVKHSLELGDYDMCFACRMPINDEDKKNKYYIKGQSCHHCFTRSNVKQKQRFKERQKQIEIAKKKNQSHIGQPNSKDKY